VGLIAIAFAQLERTIYLAAKRRASTPLIEWDEATNDDRFSTWCRHLTKEYSDDSRLLRLVERAQCAAESRHDLIHAIWGKHPTKGLGRWRRHANLGLELEPLEDLLATIRELRDAINRHTLRKS